MTTTAPVASIELVVNGTRVRADDASSHLTLLDFLRNQGLTGSKEGCAEGECGACAVAMVVPYGQQSAYRAINSCLMLLPAAAGGEFYTVEALARDGHLSEVQHAIASAGGSQCGYCTPGFVVSLFAEQYRRDRTGPCDPSAMSGNLCRCTGYRPIRDAARALGPAPAGPLLSRLARPAPATAAIAAPGFSRPSTVEDCVAIIASDRTARLLAGGTDVAVEANLHYGRWPHLVSVEAIDELRVFSDGVDAVTIGAGVPLADIGSRWRDAPPAVHEWLELFASPLIRHRATLGGNLATASPIGDAAPLLLALDARLQLAGPAGRRRIALSEFFTGYRKTALASEIIVAIDIPKPLPQMVRFYKIAKRRLDDISTVAAALAIDRDVDDRVMRARIAFGGVAATPIRVTAAEDEATGRRWSESVSRIHQAIDQTITPMTDHRGSREFRLAVSKSLVEKFGWEVQ
jgi:xanthine dehydrogenase small subunit